MPGTQDIEKEVAYLRDVEKMAVREDRHSVEAWA